jgi:hypothetical protein
MAPQPRWTVPVNMRAQDKQVLDAALSIAKNEGRDITSVFRMALAEFVKTRSGVNEERKMDEFLVNTSEISVNRLYNRVLTPGELKGWSDASLVDSAKLVRARKQELDSELRKRGYFLKW